MPMTIYHDDDFKVARTNLQNYAEPNQKGHKCYAFQNKIERERDDFGLNSSSVRIFWTETIPAQSFFLG